jgi:hypothetical protein
MGFILIRNDPFAGNCAPAEIKSPGLELLAVCGGAIKRGRLLSGKSFNLSIGYPIIHKRCVTQQTQAPHLPNNCSRGRSTVQPYLTVGREFLRVRSQKGRVSRRKRGFEQAHHLFRVRLGMSGKQQPLPDSESGARNKIGNLRNI